jgi:putative nucleotidyltransferase with HDIG domain
VSPTYPQDDVEYLISLLPEVNEIASKELRQKVIEIWLDVWRSSDWERIEDVPKALAASPHKLYKHIQSVTRLALATSEIIERVHGVKFNRDLVVAGSLLHDVSKLRERRLQDGSVRNTELGSLIQHAVYAAHLAWEKGLTDELVHIIVSHTYLSGHLPVTPEAILVRYVDYLDTDILLQQEGRPLTLGKH